MSAGTFWLYDLPGNFGWIGMGWFSFSKMKTWYKTLRAFGILAAIIESAIGIIVAVVVGFLVWVGSTAHWANTHNACLRLSTAWNGVGWPGTYRKGCR